MRKFICTALSVSFLACILVACGVDVTLISFEVGADASLLDVGETAGIRTELTFLVGREESAVFSLDTEILKSADGREYSEKEIEKIRQTAQSYAVFYTSDRPDVAAVDARGVVTAAAPGNAVITVTVAKIPEEDSKEEEEAEEPLTAQVAVQVYQSVQAVTVEEDSIELYPDDAEVIDYEILPENASSHTDVFVSADENVAKVDSAGNVTAVGVGETDITLTVTDEYSGRSLMVAVHVTVTERPAPETPDNSGDSGGSDGSGSQAPDNQNPVQPGPDAWHQELLSLVNAARAEAGVAPLAWSDSLHQSAQVRAAEIIQSFSHTRPDGSSCFTVNPLCHGENIAAGYKSVQEVFDGWMNSPGHRENILTDWFTIFGSGYVYQDGTRYRHYWVQLFG